MNYEREISPPEYLEKCDLCGDEITGDSVDLFDDYDSYTLCESCYKDIKKSFKYSNC